MLTYAEIKEINYLLGEMDELDEYGLDKFELDNLGEGYIDELPF